MGRADGPDVDGVPIDAITEKIGELRTLETVVADKGLIDAGEVMLKPVIDDDVTISPDDWAAIVSLVQPFTFESLAERLGRGAAIRMIHAFHRLGIAEAVTNTDAAVVIEPVPGEVSEEESNWLDRLADEVSSTDSTKWLEDAVAEMTAETEDAPVAREIDEPQEEPADSELVITPDEAPAPAPGARGLSAPASTTLTTGVYDDIRRLRSKVSE
jgi:hypothetical protein